MVQPINSINSAYNAENSIIFKSTTTPNFGVVVDKVSPKIKVDWLNIDKILDLKTPIPGPNQCNRVGKYSPETVKRIRDSKIDKEQEHISNPVGARTAYNTNQLKKAGVKNSDIKRYLTYDGHVNFEGKRILKEKGLTYK